MKRLPLKDLGWEKLLKVLNQLLAHPLPQESFLNKILLAISKAAKIKRAFLCLLEGKEKRRVIPLFYHFGKTPSVKLEEKEENILLSWMSKERKILIKKELELERKGGEAKRILEILNSLEIEICLPLIIKDRLMGIIALGKKGGEGGYSLEEIERLTLLAPYLALILENIRLGGELKKTKALIQSNNRLTSLGMLIAGLAHEIRNPLVAIKTFIQLLPERLRDKEFRTHFFNITSGELDRITTLVNELLEFARPAEPFWEESNINEILEKMLLLVAFEAKKGGVNIKKNYTEELPLIKVDQEQIKQVFLNLFLNAMEATPENGLIFIKTRVLKKGREKGYIQVEIRDTGKGIPPEKLEYIFTPFYSTKLKGSGLGLFISRQIVKEHQGNIEVRSKPGKGTTFYVNLPLNLSGQVRNI